MNNNEFEDYDQSDLDSEAEKAVLNEDPEPTIDPKSLSGAAQRLSEMDESMADSDSESNESGTQDQKYPTDETIQAAADAADVQIEANPLANLVTSLDPVIQERVWSKIVGYTKQRLPAATALNLVVRAIESEIRG